MDRQTQKRTDETRNAAE